MFLTSQRVVTIFSRLRIDCGQTLAWPSYKAACFGDVSLTSCFSSVSPGCATKQKYHTLCENLSSAQFLFREIVTFCAEIGMSELENGRGKK